MPAERVAIVGGRAARALRILLREGLASPSNVRFVKAPEDGASFAPEEARVLREAGVVVFQQRRRRRPGLIPGELRSVTQGALVTVPPIENPAIAALCATGWTRRATAGRIHGDQAVLAQLDEGMTLEEVIAAYVEGSTDFNLAERFEKALKRMRQDDLEADVLLGEKVAEYHRSARLFLTHRDPATALLVEICEQLQELTGLPIDMDRLRAIEAPNHAGIETFDECPVSPHDAAALGYEFAPDPDWAKRGTALIRAIAARREAQ